LGQALIPAAISLVRRDQQPVPECGHAWTNHPEALISLIHCVDCIVEEDHGDRDDGDMCSRVPPDSAHVPVGDSLVARYKRRPLRGDRVLIEDVTGGRWALLRPPAADPQQVERLLLEVRSDWARMPITPLREKYRQLMDPLSPRGPPTQRQGERRLPRYRQ